jgi:hypothetical protein
MHRSGTSAFARVLSLLGCDLPKTLMLAHKSNETGHWESDVIRHLNDRILASAGTKWDDWLEVNPGWLQSPKAEEFREEALALLREEFGPSRLFVLKDPRICRLLPFWLGVLEEAGARPLIVSPVRNPLEVAASLEERNGFEAGLGHLLWLRHVLDAEFASRGTRRFFTSYDRLMSAWARTATDAQSTLGIAWPRMSDKVAGEIEGFLSDNHRHYRQPVEAVLENPILSDWLRSAYEILARWTAAGEDPQDFAAFDRIRTELNTAAPAFSRLLGAEQAKARRLENELDSGRQRLGKSEQHIFQLESELESRAGAAKAAEQTLAEACSKLGAAESAVAAEQERVSRLESELVSERQRLEASEEQISRLKSDLETRTRAAEEAERSLMEVRHRLAQTESALAQRRHEAEQTAGELAATREDLRQMAAARAEGEKVSAGLKEHVVLLMADVKERQAAFAAAAQARATQAAEADNAMAAVAGQVKQVLAVLETSRHELATRLAAQEQETARTEAQLRERTDEIASLTRLLHQIEAEAAEAAIAHSRQSAELDSRLKQQADEIAALRRLVEEKQGEAHHERSEAERIRQVAAGEIGSAVAGLLNGRGSPFHWRPFRVRRQAALLRRSGLFDAEWYLREYADVARAGIDPLRHYVEYGAKEGRAPNPALKVNGHAGAAKPESTGEGSP